MYSFKCLSLLLFTLFVLQCNESVILAPDAGIDPQSALARGLKGRVQKVEYYRLGGDANGLVDSMQAPILDSALVFFSNGLLQTKLDAKSEDLAYFYDNNGLILTITIPRNTDYVNKAFYVKYYSNNKLELTAMGGIYGGQANFIRVSTFSHTRGKIEEKTYVEVDSLLYVMNSVSQVSQLESMLGDEASIRQEHVVTSYYVSGALSPFDNPINDITKYYSTTPDAVALRITKVTQGDGKSDLYEYDENGFLVSVSAETELWDLSGTEYYQYNKETGKLETKKFVYKHGDNTILTTYDQQGNIVSISNGSNSEKYEYVYDSVGNWLSRKQFVSTPKATSLRQYDIRKITYFEQPVAETVYPAPDKQFMDDIYRQAIVFASTCQQNHEKLLAYCKAVENEEYDTDFSITEANNIEDFTPNLWKIDTNIEADYNGDGTMDRIVVYDTPLLTSLGDTKDGYNRVLALFKQVNGKWILYKSFRDLLPARDCWNCRAGGLYRGVGFDKGYIIIYEVLEMAQGYESATYYRYLTDEKLATEGEGLYLMKKVRNSYDGSEAFRFDSTDYENGIQKGESTYDYENENESPRGKNGTFSSSSVIKTKPKRIYNFK